MTTTTTTAGELELAGWRRQVAELHATVRQAPTPPEKSLGRCGHRRRRVARRPDKRPTIAPSPCHPKVRVRDAWGHACPREPKPVPCPSRAQEGPSRPRPPGPSAPQSRSAALARMERGNPNV